MLTTGGIVATAASGSDWPGFYSKMPDIPTNCLSVHDYTGPGIPSQRKTITLFPRFQIMVRGTDYDLAYAKLANAANYLLDNQNSDVVLNSITYKIASIRQLGSIMYLGREEKDRSMKVSLNYFLGFRG